MVKKPKRLSGLKREQIILDRLKDRSLPAPTFRDMADEIGPDFDEKTIRRDIKSLRDKGADIQLEGSGQNTVYVLQNDFRLPNTFSAADLLSLTILRQAIQGYSGKYLEKQLEDITGRVGKVTLEQRDYSAADIDAAITFRPPPVQPVNPDLWRAVLTAVLTNSSLDVDYGGRQGGGRKMSLHPYHMVCSEGDWYLLAGKPGNPKPAQYNLARIVHWVVGPGNNFKTPANFDAKALLDKSFRGFISAGRTKTVKVRINGFMVQYVKNRIFHPRQKIKEHDGGMTLEISFEAGADGPFPFGNVVSWVLSMGPCAQVLEPPELIKLVKQEARGLLANYEKLDQG